jgi:hypothetical protein
VAELWRSADEDLRSAARETVLSFGNQSDGVFINMLICMQLLDYINHLNNCPEFNWARLPMMHHFLNSYIMFLSEG